MVIKSDNRDCSVHLLCAFMSVRTTLVIKVTATYVVTVTLPRTPMRRRTPIMWMSKLRLGDVAGETWKVLGCHPGSLLQE